MALDTFTTTAASLTLTTGEMLELQPGTNQVLTRLDGWFSPAGTRREGTDRLWAHGSFSERGWRDQRIITLGGHIFTTNRTDAANMTDTLSAALADGTAGKFIVNDVDLGYREATVFISGTPSVHWDGNLDIFFMIDMVAPDPRKYGPTLTASTLAAAPGGGLGFDLFVPSPPPALRTNIVPNPSFELGVASVVKNSGTTVDTTAFASALVAGGAALNITTGGSGTPYVYEDVPITGGQWVAWAANVRWSSGSRYVKLRLGFRDDANVDVGGQVDSAVTYGSNAAGGVRLTATAKAPSSATKARLILYFYNDAAGTVAATAGSGWHSDAWHAAAGTTQAEAEAGIVTYFDGTTPPADGKFYNWTGNPHNSASYETAYSPVLDFGTAGTPGTATLENVGTADAAPVFTVSGYAPGFTITEVASGARLVYTQPVLAGQTLVINAADGSVLLDGYADRSAYLSRREWTRVPGRTRNTYLFESPGNVGASLTLEMRPAWW